MKIEKLIQDLQGLQELYPNAEVYFTDGALQRGCFETYFQNFFADEETNTIEMLFDPEEE